MKNWLKPLKQQYLDINLNTSSSHETRVLETPGLWFSEAELNDLQKDLFEVANKTVAKGSLNYGVFATNKEAFNHSIITIIFEKRTQKPVAFNALVVIDIDLGHRKERVMHLGLAMVAPEARSQGFSWILYGLTCFFLFLRNRFKPIWISNVTQVPSVVGMVGETFSDVYPSPHSDNRASLVHVLLSRRIMKSYRHIFGVGEDAGYDEDRFVITNAYTGGSDHLKKSFDEAAKHRKSVFNDFCQKQLNYKRGDDVLQLGKIDLDAAHRFVVQSVPKNAIVELSVAAFWMLLNRLALPIFYWFHADRQWNNLRPYVK